MRIVSEQRNLWGVQGRDAPNAQRADLWTLDLSNAVKSLNQQIRSQGATELSTLLPVETYFAQSVTLPELKVNAEAFRRDSRSYMMPMNDEAPGPISVKFYLETNVTPRKSIVYQLMDTWRAFVRGGRGAYTNEGFVPSLPSSWVLSYAFDITVSLYRGCLNSEVEIIDYFTGVSAEYYGDKTAFMEEVNRIKDPELREKRLRSLRTSAGLFDPLGIKNDLKRSSSYSLDKCWLSSFKLSELSYATGNQLVMIEATFYADNIRDVTDAPTRT